MPAASQALCCPPGQAFHQPRKTLANNLGRRYAEALEASAIDGRRRPAELSVEEYIHLCLVDPVDRREAKREKLA